MNVELTNRFSKQLDSVLMENRKITWIITYNFFLKIINPATTNAAFTINSS